MSDQGKWSDPSEFFKVCGLEEWTFERAEKMARSFQTPLHRNFQLTCEYARTLQATLMFLLVAFCFGLAKADKAIGKLK